MTKKVTLKGEVITVMECAGEPLNTNDITVRVLARGLWKTKGKTPQNQVARVLTKNPKTFVKVKRGFYALRSNATGTQLNTDPPTTNRPPQPAPPPPPHEKDKLFLEQRVDLLEECCDHLKSEIKKLRGYLASENKWKKALDALLADLEEEP